jgi:hypothetical protein
MWCLVATERALQAHGLLTKMMTPEQIEQAQQAAGIWLSRLKHTPPTLADSAPSTHRATFSVTSLPLED